MMKKSLLALAVAALSANAFAIDVDYTVTPLVPNRIPNELTFSNTITTNDALTWELGTDIASSETRYIRISLNNGNLFSAAPTLAIDGTAFSTIVAGGANESYVVFEVTGATLTSSDDVVLTLGNLILTSKADVTAAFSVYGQAQSAVEGNDSYKLYSKAAAPYIVFVPGLIAGTDAAATTQKIIDVAATPTATKFTNSTTSATIGGTSRGIRVALNETLQKYDTASSVVLSDLTGTASKVVVTGDFSAAKTAAGAFDLSKVELNGVPATAVTEKTATFDFDGTTELGSSSSYDELEYSVDGTTVIVPATYTAELKVGAASGSSLANTTISLGKVGELAKNGSTAYVDLALNPAGAFANYIRITNKTNVTGNVYLTLFNDAGKSVSFPLSAIEGQSASLEAQASTAQIIIGQVYAAAQATDPTFAVAQGRNKLRLVVDGEFAGSNEDISGISVQSYSVAKDGNSFNTF
ncbi:hypothetical protein [Azorhizophilus paspali]|uniref:Uncharacterized protein n=1 Tax=Azorhizophilus paspali TaxID=69963 RepID=A0ABV6SLQ3_AZOPA